MTLRSAVLLVSSLALSIALSACGDDSSSDNPCPPGQVVDYITGECRAPRDTVAPDAGNDVSVPDSAADVSAPDLDAGDDAEMDIPPQPDLVPDVTVDMGTPDTTMDMDMAQDMGMPPTGTVRFVAIGDVGTGSSTQLLVGQSIGTVCTGLGGCDFGLLLGDNFYDTGVDGVMDSLWDDYFVTPYGHLPFSWYAVLGNHDLGGDGLGIDLDFMKGDYQVAYSGINPKWIMPAKHYTFDWDFLSFVALNSTDIFFGQDSGQRAQLAAWTPQLAGTWKIAFGHHPYLSNGKHGNAGEYEGIPDWLPGSAIPRGDHVKSFMEDMICGKFDLYICGHDHSRQDLGAACGTEFIVSGAGAKTSELGGNNPSNFESLVEGFVIIEATATTLTIQFYDENGVMDHSRVVTR